MEHKKSTGRVLKNTLYLYFRMLFLMFISFYTSRVILNNLGITDYGIYNVVGGLASMFVFFRSSLSNVTQRCLNIELGKNDIRAAQQVFCLHQTLYIVISILLVILLETLGMWFLYNKLVIPIERMTSAFWVFQFTIFSLVLTVLSVVYDSLIIAHEHMKIYSYVGIVEGIFKLIIAFLIGITVWNKLIVYALMLFLLSLGLRIFYSHYCHKHYKECRFSFAWNIDEIKEASSLVGWNTLGTMVWSLNEQGINILLNMFFGPAVNAARGLSQHLSHAVNNFGTNFYTSVRPQLVKSYASQDWNYLYKLFFSSSKFSVYLLWFFCLPLMLCIDEVLNIWLKEVPEYTDEFTIWILAYSLVNILNNPIWSLALAVGKLKCYILIGSSVFFLAFPLSYICLSLGYSPVSVFICLFVVRFVYIGVVINIIRRYIPISIKKYLKDVIIPVSIVVLVSGSVSYCISIWIGKGIINSIIIGMISWIVIGISVYFIGVKSNEKTLIMSYVKKKFK